MKKIPFSTTMQLLELLKKMDFNFNLEFDTPEALGKVIINDIMLKMPKVQDEFLALLNKLAGTNYDTESDTFEIIGTIMAEYEGVVKAFTQALKLKNSIS